MKVLFVGPSLPDAQAFAASGIECRPPVRQGDVMQAVQDGATAIGLVDGLFELVAPVWHKELLFALSQGIPVLGAASMGALRAAECAPFGMIGIGQIYDEYASGHRIDDADVALLHGPAELNYPAITVPMVNIDATLAGARQLGLFSQDLCDTLSSAARAIFFKERSWKHVVQRAGLDWETLAPVIALARTDQKRDDALQLLAALADPGLLENRLPDWTFNATPLWRKMYPS